MSRYSILLFAIDLSTLVDSVARLLVTTTLPIIYKKAHKYLK